MKMAVDKPNDATGAGPSTTPERVAAVAGGGGGGLKGKAAQQRNKKKQAMYRRHIGKTTPQSPKSGDSSAPTTATETTLDEKAASKATPSSPGRATAAAAGESKVVVGVTEGTSTPERQSKSPRPQLAVDANLTTTTEGGARPGRSPSDSRSPTSSSSPINRRQRSTSAGARKGRKTELVKRMFADRNKASQEPKVPPSSTTTTTSTEQESLESPTSQPVAKNGVSERNDYPMDEISAETKGQEEVEKEVDPIVLQPSKEQDLKQDHAAATIDETKSDTSNAFDMRSIHDYPPSPPPEPEEPMKEEDEEKEADPSWDPNSAAAYFDDSKVERASSKREPGKPAADGLNMFETDSWAVTNAEFESLPGAHADIEALANRLKDEEARAKETMSDKDVPQNNEREQESKISQQHGSMETEISPKLSVEAVSEFTQQLQLNDASVGGDIDPTWDVTSAVFQKKLEEAKKAHMNGDPLNMFDTASWGETDAAFSDVSLSRFAQHQDIETEFLRLMKEDLVKRGQLPGEAPTTHAVEDAHAAATARIHEEKKTADPEEGDKREYQPPKDDQPLLTGANSSSEDDGNHAVAAADAAPNSNGKVVLTMEDRVKIYTAPQNPDDYSSAVEEEGTDHTEGDDFEEGEEVEVAYVDQASDDEAEGEAIFGIDLIPTPTVSAEDVPTFDVSGIVPPHPPRSMEIPDAREPNSETGATESSVAMDISANSALMGEHFLGAPPPPPPPGEKKKKRRSKNKSGRGEKNDIPLLPPPPEDKVKKWEEGKMRAHNHIAALKAGGSPNVNGSLSPVDSARALALQNALGRAAIEGPENTSAGEDKGLKGDHSTDQEGDVEGPPVLTRKAFEDEFGQQLETGGLFVDVGAEPHQRLFGATTPKSKASPSKPSIEATRSPAAGATILSDQNLAQKVARASSAAAFKFESALLKKADSNVLSPSSAGDEDDIARNPVAPNPLNLGLCAPDNMDNIRENFLSMTGSVDGGGVDVTDGRLGTPSASNKSDCNDKDRGTGVELVGGAFSPWKNSGFNNENSPMNRAFFGEDHDDGTLSAEERLSWFCREILKTEPSPTLSQEDPSLEIRLLMDDNANFNAMCQYMAEAVNITSAELSQAANLDELEVLSTEESLKSLDTMESFVKKRPRLKPMTLSEESKKLKPNLLAANFVSFLALASKLAKVESPFGEENPFLLNLVELSMRGGTGDTSSSEASTVQQVVFGHSQGSPDAIILFVYQVCESSKDQILAYRAAQASKENGEFEEVAVVEVQSIPNAATDTTEVAKSQGGNQVVLDGRPSPFESCVTSEPRIVVIALSFLGDPVAVCRMKMVNQFCRRIISENEHMIMRDAVRAGGLSMNVRPAFWMWITLQKCGRSPDIPGTTTDVEENCNSELIELERQGREGKWHSVIQRDVTRSFGNMPPHKTGAKLRTDSIVRALVTWGKNRIMTRGVKGGGDVVPTPKIGSRDGQKFKGKPQASTSPPPWQADGDDDSQKSELSQTPTDTVSDWGGVSPVESFAGSMSGLNDGDPESRWRYTRQNSRSTPAEELALSGNALTDDMKVDLQNKLGFILHAMAASHEDVGYCQGMDYVVAHLLRILQDTIKWKYLRGTLPTTIKAAQNRLDPAEIGAEDPQELTQEINERLLVEETVYRVMDTFFTTYNLRHMYWPELRYLKICCRVFERLIQIKLPVLADHFQHHELSIGLFALGWFQTLFLYLPSMPSATVCHMWDIWLVERSFKIFFRVGTAILFLSQPILLNHELEGMMTYLNTIPDATLLNPDILIACALNIKVTNSMLTELEEEVTRT